MKNIMNDELLKKLSDDLTNVLEESLTNEEAAPCKTESAETKEKKSI
jgi:hypothetical protein